MDKVPLAREDLWIDALSITGRSSLHRDPVPLIEIERRLSKFSDNTVFHGGGYREVHIDQFRPKIQHLRVAGETEILPPWPGPNKFGGNYTWEQYTSEQLLCRAKAVFEGALEAYQQIVTMWFSSLAPRMAIAVMLPARIVVKLGSTSKGRPITDWYLNQFP